MKLKLRLALTSEPLSAALRAQSLDGWFDAASPNAGRAFELVAKHGGAPWLHRDFAFSAGEIATAPRLEVRPAVTLAQTTAEAERTTAVSYRTPASVGPCGWNVRLPAQLFLGKPIKPSTIAHVDQWTGEYVLGKEVADSLEASGLGGAALRRVWRLKPAEARDDVFHLVTTNLLPCALRDATWKRAVNRECPGRYGLLAYPAESLRDAPDFARTAEPWNNWDVPAWTIGPRVHAWYRDERLRGWRFWPLLTEGSALHEMHARLIAQVLHSASACGARLMA